jgi:hypothetical protein
MTRFTQTLTAAAALMIGAGTASFAAEADISAVDRNNDGIGSFAEFRLRYPTMTRADYAVLDIDGDGVVVDAELSVGESQLLLESFGDAFAEIDVTADIDADGEISYNELVTLTPGFPTDQYASLDFNGDGTLDLVEYNSAEAQAIISAWEETVVFIRVEDHDANGDGILDDAELASAIPGYEPGDLELIPTEPGATAGRNMYRPIARVVTD